MSGAGEGLLLWGGASTGVDVLFSYDCFVQRLYIRRALGVSVPDRQTLTIRVTILNKVGPVVYHDITEGIVNLFHRTPAVVKGSKHIPQF